MNKTAIKNFSIGARNKLIADVSYKAGLMGITANGIAKPLPQSTGSTEFYDIGTKEPYAISGEAVRQRRQLVQLLERKTREKDYATAYKYVLEEVAYTWFNRLIAIRFMEVNDYLPSHVRVLSSDSGKMEPDLVTTPFDAELDFTEAEKDAIRQMKLDNAIDELFQMLFIKQCNALNAILPGLFEKTNDYTELLLSVSVIDQDGVVYHLIHDIPEEDWKDQVQIIGWLYQYYNTEPKDQVFADLKKNIKISKEKIPAATQLFTPDWIVRYMVENSLGRLWVEGHANEELKKGWKYYLEEAEQEPEVQAQLAEIRKGYAAIRPEEIRVIDPCMGSGHILVYLFEVLMQIYESAGWTLRDAAQSIVENNLYGLDIDERATQLAYFAVMMKARQYDRRILTRGVRPNVFAIQESNAVNRDYLKLFGELRPTAEKLMDNMKDAKEYGSILIIHLTGEELRGLRSALNEIAETEYDNFFDSARQNGLVNEFEPLLYVAEVLAQKYDVVVTNPPYMGGSGMGIRLSQFVKENYPNSKSDMSTVFMEKCISICKEKGYIAMINIPVWMFLTSFESMRERFIAAYTLSSLVHPGRGIFGSDFGSVTFVFWKNKISNYLGQYCRLFSGSSEVKSIEEREYAFLHGVGRFFANQDDYPTIPGSPIAYWVSSKVYESFKGKRISDYADTRSGMSTTDNVRFLRLWFEESITNIKLDCLSLEEASRAPQKWYPYNKGGDFRKWYGNNAYVVNWYNDGAEIKYWVTHNPKDPNTTSWGRRIFATDCFFKAGITWSSVTIGAFSCRLYNTGFIFDSGANGLFAFNTEQENYLAALLNSKVGNEILEIINPTVNSGPGSIAKIPVILGEQERVCKIVDSCVSTSKDDWDSFETSWDFEWHPLAKKGLSRSHWNADHVTIEECFRAWADECDSRFAKLKANEEELNRIFIEIYDLEEELTPEVEDKDITVRRADLQRDIKSLLSYAVGCMLGRYSLGSTGLVFAGGEWDDRKYSQFKPDADNIIPLTDEDYLEDDIISRLCDFLKIAFGERTLETNLDYIAAALGGKGNSSREIIRSYFLNSFFDDHCQTYSVTGSGKRPIYWLFDSGKQIGFKALIYLHRYNADTIGNLRVDYLHKMQRIYESEIGRMQDAIDHSSNAREIAAATKRKEKLQKQLKECRDYDEKIGHLALSRIELDLDDGVKVNYRKLQTAQDGKFYEVLAKSKDIMAKEK